MSTTTNLDDPTFLNVAQSKMEAKSINVKEFSDAEILIVCRGNEKKAQKIRALLQKADVDGDGNLSPAEVLQITADVLDEEANSTRLFKIAGALIFCVLLLVGLNAALTYVTVDALKDTSVSNGNSDAADSHDVLVTKGSGTPVGTVEVRPEANMIALPVVEHGKTESISFTSDLGYHYTLSIVQTVVFSPTHAMHVSDAGVRLEAKNGIITAHGLYRNATHTYDSVICAHMDCFSFDWEKIDDEVEAMNALVAAGFDPKVHPRTRACGWEHGACTQSYTPFAQTHKGSDRTASGGRRRRDYSRRHRRECSRCSNPTLNSVEDEEEEDGGRVRKEGREDKEDNEYDCDDGKYFCEDVGYCVDIEE